MIFLEFFFANHIFALFWVFIGESQVSMQADGWYTPEEG